VNTGVFFYVFIVPDNFKGTTNLFLKNHAGRSEVRVDLGFEKPILHQRRIHYDIKIGRAHV